MEKRLSQINYRGIAYIPSSSVLHIRVIWNILEIWKNPRYGTETDWGPDFGAV